MDLYDLQNEILVYIGGLPCAYVFLCLVNTSRLLEDGIDGIIFGYLPSPRQAICGNVE